MGKAWLRCGWTGLHGAAKGGEERPRFPASDQWGTSKGTEGSGSPGQVCRGLLATQGTCLGRGGTGEHSPRKGRGAQGHLWNAIPGTRRAVQPGPALGSAPPAPALGPKRTGFSTLAGSDPCPLSLQRGPWAPLVSQLSGSHCAPVTVQGNQCGAGAHPRAAGTCGRRSSTTRA